MKAKLRILAGDQLRLERRKGIDTLGDFDLGANRSMPRQIEIHREMARFCRMQTVEQFGQADRRAPDPKPRIARKNAPR
jgi:hypothetical protein